MSRGARVFLFVSVATLANLALTALLFIALLGLYSISLARLLPPGAVTWAVMASFALALVGTVFAYRILVGLARKRFRLDDILGPPPARKG